MQMFSEDQSMLSPEVRKAPWLLWSESSANSSTPCRLKQLMASPPAKPCMSSAAERRKNTVVVSQTHPQKADQSTSQQVREDRPQTAKGKDREQALWVFVPKTVSHFWGRLRFSHFPNAVCWVKSVLWAIRPDGHSVAAACSTCTKLRRCMEQNSVYGCVIRLCQPAFVGLLEMRWHMKGGAYSDPSATSFRCRVRESASEGGVHSLLV